MKKALVILTFLTVFHVTLMAQPAAPPPPPVTANNGGNNGPIGGNGAPIDGGVAITLIMVAGYGAWNLFKSIKLNPAE